jgi:molybdopterin molybdotransferase
MMLSFAEAQKRVLAAFTPRPAETVRLEDAAGRVLAEDVRASGPLPPFDHSAMDGVAIAFADGVDAWTLGGEARAGGEAGVLDGAAAISTGARLPLGADTVIASEHLVIDGDQVRARAAVRPGQNVRRAGEDLAAGAVALAAGTRLTPAALGLAAALDLTTLSVRRRPRVTLITTGDELRPPGSAARPGSIPDANGVMLAALIAEHGGVVTRAGCADDPGAVAAAIRAALATDLVITVGGVSVGAHDHVRAALGASVVFAGVAMKPGKPVAFAIVGDTPVLALPGNPGAAFVTFQLFAVPLLTGASLRTLPARLAQARGSRGRTEFARGRLVPRGDELWVELETNQAPGALTSLATCDCLVQLDGETPAGTLVPVWGQVPA